jgi:hypothetical protein
MRMEPLAPTGGCWVAPQLWFGHDKEKNIYTIWESKPQLSNPQSIPVLSNLIIYETNTTCMTTFQHKSLPGIKHNHNLITSYGDLVGPEIHSWSPISKHWFSLVHTYFHFYSPKAQYPYIGWHKSHYPLECTGFLL